MLPVAAAQDRPMHPQFRHSFLQWLKRPPLRPLITRIEPEIALRLTTGESAMQLSARKRFIYRLFVGFVWEIMLANDGLGLHAKEEEPEIGNPMRVWQNGKLIAQDLTNSIIECNIIGSALAAAQHRPRVAEIGGGYGRVAHVYARTLPGTYFLFDIAPALNVAQWYLTRTLPDKRIFAFRPFDDSESVRKEVEQADIALFAANQLKLIPKAYFDMMLTISTLPEMRPDQASMYMDYFRRLSKSYVFLRQWKNWQNAADGTDMRPDDYDLGRDWSLEIYRTDQVNPQFFNRVWRKTT